MTGAVRRGCPGHGPLALFLSLIFVVAWTDAGFSRAGGATSEVTRDAVPKTMRLAQRRTASCNYPWTYSSRRRRCVCALHGYGLVDGRCVLKTPKCAKHAEWSKEQGACICTAGYVGKRGRCVETEAARAAREAREAAARPRLPDVAMVQSCLKEAGFLKGPVRRRMTRSAWNAYWRFKRAHAVGRTPDGVRNIGALRKLFALCPSYVDQGPLIPVVVVADDAPNGGTAAEPAAVRTATLLPAAEPRPGASCLAPELHRLISSVYGPRPSLAKCAPACVPVPKGLGKSEISDHARRHGVRWCRDCIEIGAQVPLDDILSIEKGTGQQICARPSARLPQWRAPSRGSARGYARVRALYGLLPPHEDHETDIAVIIGNRNYREGIVMNATAHNNASAIYALLTEKLDYDPENIIDLRDATLEELTKLFGTSENPEGELWRRTRGRENARVLIYFAGHGTTSADRSESFLLPVDSVPHRAGRTAYAMSVLFSNLAKLEASSTTVFLEAGFGREIEGYVFPPNLPGLRAGSLPARALPRVSVLAAGTDDQKPLVDPDQRLGLFTRYLIEALAGQADVPPIGNGDRRIDTVEVYAFVAHMVGLAARKSYGLLQQPRLSFRRNHPLGRLQAQTR